MLVPTPFRCPCVALVFYLTTQMPLAVVADNVGKLCDFGLTKQMRQTVTAPAGMTTMCAFTSQAISGGSDMSSGTGEEPVGLAFEVHAASLSGGEKERFSVHVSIEEISHAMHRGRYAAPEVLSGKGGSEKSDIFSFGVSVLEVYQGAPPNRAAGFRVQARPQAS